MIKHKFFSEKNILYNFQSGFRPNQSTNLCLAHLTDKILKGFDTINHEVLLQKLKAIRFSEQSI